MVGDGGRRRQAARGATTAIAGALLVAAVAGGCGGDPAPDAAADTVAPATTAGPGATTASTSTAPSSTVPAGPTARLRVSQDLTACCYPRSHVSWLVVRDEAGDEVVQRRFRPLSDAVPAVDVVLGAGRYHVVSAQQPCTTSTCARVGDPVDRCDADVVLGGGDEVFLTVGVAPGAGCAVVLAPGPLPSTVADEVALPGDAVDCGLDPTLAEVAATGRPVPIAVARRCLMAAVDRRAPAWLLAEEPELVVYRSRADGSVDVYRVLDEQAPTWAWVRSSCAEMAPDELRGFLLRDCDPPEAVPWA